MLVWEVVIGPPGVGRPGGLTPPVPSTPRSPRNREAMGVRGPGQPSRDVGPMIRLPPAVQSGAPVMTRERPFDDSLNPEPRAEDLPPTRRRLLQALAGLGVGSAVFRRALAAAADKAPAVTADMIRQAEW